MARTITRFQEIRWPGDGVQVTAWGPHRYEGSERVVPPTVGLTLRHFALEVEGRSAPEFEVRVDLTPAGALRLAEALSVLAGKAEAAALTDDNVPDAPAVVPAPAEIDPPEVR